MDAKGGRSNPVVGCGCKKSVGGGLVGWEVRQAVACLECQAVLSCGVFYRANVLNLTAPYLPSPTIHLIEALKSELDAPKSELHICPNVEIEAFTSELEA
jgi:hypothetical protein